MFFLPVNYAGFLLRWQHTIRSPLWFQHEFVSKVHTLTLSLVLSSFKHHRTHHMWHKFSPFSTLILSQLSIPYRLLYYLLLPCSSLLLLLSSLLYSPSLLFLSLHLSLYLSFFAFSPSLHSFCLSFFWLASSTLLLFLFLALLSLCWLLLLLFFSLFFFCGHFSLPLRLEGSLPDIICFSNCKALMKQLVSKHQPCIELGLILFWSNIYLAANLVDGQNGRKRR